MKIKDVVIGGVIGAISALLATGLAGYFQIQASEKNYQAQVAAANRGYEAQIKVAEKNLEASRLIAKSTLEAAEVNLKAVRETNKHTTGLTDVTIDANNKRMQRQLDSVLEQIQLSKKLDIENQITREGIDEKKDITRIARLLKAKILNDIEYLNGITAYDSLDESYLNHGDAVSEKLKGEGKLLSIFLGGQIIERGEVSILPISCVQALLKYDSSLAFLRELHSKAEVDRLRSVYSIKEEFLLAIARGGEYALKTVDINKVVNAIDQFVESLKLTIKYAPLKAKKQTIMFAYSFLIELEKTVFMNKKQENNLIKMMNTELEKLKKIELKVSKCKADYIQATRDLMLIYTQAKSVRIRELTERSLRRGEDLLVLP